LLGSEAATLMQLGEYESAAESAASSAELLERAYGPQDERLGIALNALGNARSYAGDYHGARQALERALAIRIAVYGAEDARTGVALSNLGTVLEDLEEPAEALRYYERALASFEKAYGPDHPRVATPLNNLGHLYAKTGDPVTACRYYERALAIRAAKLGTDHPSYALTLQNLATAQHAAGDSERALEGLRQALAIREARLSDRHPDIAVTLVNLAGVLIDLGRAAEAEPLIERALAIRAASLGPEHRDYANTLGVRVRARRALGRPAEALEDALAAEAIGREHLRVTARWLPERQALQFAARRPGGLDAALAIAAEWKPPAAAVRAVWDAAVRSRALVLDEMGLRLQAAHVASDAASAEASARLIQTSARYARLLVGAGPAPPGDARQVLATARGEYENAERALAEASAAFGREVASERIGLDDVVRAAPADTALVAYVRHAVPEADGAAYAAFVLPAGTGRAPRLFALGTAAEIDRLAGAWRDAVAATATPTVDAAIEREREARSIGAELRARIWDSVVPAIEGAKRVFLVPDGTLNLVPFGALPSASGYLVEHAPALHYLSTERDVPRALAPSDAASEAGLLALGGPAFDDAAAGAVHGAQPSVLHRGATAGCDSFRALRFAPLPSAEREVTEVAAVFGRGTGGATRLLVGAEAAETAFKRLAPRSAILHVATHGFVLGGSCGGPGSLPLQLAGLALAGANRRAAAREGEEDGILTAEEIAALDLSGVRWAALSGCDTGTGRIEAGEGVLGLRRAFAVAGARTLVLSLWPVEDRDARRFMRALYEGRFGKRLAVPEAARAASLEVLRERRARGLDTSPFHWAAFTTAGDWL
jgi:CHAT domain-containing protein/tetratricopeptide (TPR) repeat protein